MVESNWHWIDEYSRPTFTLSVDGKAILADFGEYEEIYLNIPQTKNEFDQLSRDDQELIHNIYGAMPWEFKNRNKSDNITILITIATIIILLVVILYFAN